MKKSSSRSGGGIFMNEFNNRGQKFDRLKKSVNLNDVVDDVSPYHNRVSNDVVLDHASPSASPLNDVVRTSAANRLSDDLTGSSSVMVGDQDRNDNVDDVSPFSKSPWSCHVSNVLPPNDNFSNVLMGSLVREEGHIYSLAASGELLYTGSDSKNIRVWKNQKEYSAFKSNSGLVKAIVISNDRIFTGHQDGKIRIWKVPSQSARCYRRVGTLPTLKNYVKCSLKPSNYVEARKHHNVLWIKHFDAISCLSLSEDASLLYSASWDKTFKVWKVSDFKCLESVKAHDDAVNALVAGFGGLVFTGSADGTVKVWRREVQGKGTKHFFSQTLLKQECAVTALVLSPNATYAYCGSSDGLVNFWESEQSLCHGGVLRGHKLAVLCLATAGNLVFSGSADMAICVWRRMEGVKHVCLSVLTGHMGPVKCIAVEKDSEAMAAGCGEGRWIVYSGSLDKSVKMWRASEQVTTMTSGATTSGATGQRRSLSSAPTFAMGSKRFLGVRI